MSKCQKMLGGVCRGCIVQKSVKERRGRESVNLNAHISNIVRHSSIPEYCPAAACYGISVPSKGQRCSVPSFVL